MTIDEIAGATDTITRNTGPPTSTPNAFANRRLNWRRPIAICIVESVNNVGNMNAYTLEPVGFVRSTVKGREDAPRQGLEGAPDAWLEIEPRFADALLGMESGHELIVITWLMKRNAMC